MLHIDFDGTGEVPVCPTSTYGFGIAEARRVLSRGAHRASVRDERTGSVYFEAFRVGGESRSFAWRSSGMAAPAFDTLEN